MALIIIDALTSLLQSIGFAYTICYCTDKENKIHKIKLFSMVTMFLVNGQIFSGVFGHDLGINVFVTHIIALCISVSFYKKNILDSVIAYTLAYFVMCLCSIIFGNLIFAYFTDILPLKYVNYEKIFIIYLSQWIVLLLGFKYINKIKQIHRFIINERFSMIFLIMSFILDFILTFYALTLGDKNQLIKNFVYIMFFMFFVVILIYFWKIYRKSEQIYKLNQALEIKNNELRKIKHDYGAQISYLYGLGLMERFDDLKRSLKDIINNNESTPTAVEVTRNENSMLSLALRPAIETGIHVIIEENCDFQLINMSEMEFYRVTSNIVNNAIRAMNGEGIIIAKSYEYLGNAIIRIENNGPKIEEHHLTDIFKVGFTTKENNENNHGYGLSIVKDLVESHNGKIYVKSSDTATEFKIVLPIIQNT